MSRGWIAVDLDGTLTHYTGWVGPNHLGAPVPAMVVRVKKWLVEGRQVRIFTARVSPLNRCVEPNEVRVMHGTWLDNNREDDCWDAIASIRVFCVRHFGEVLAITNVKDFEMIELWDDRCTQVMPNTGETLEDNLKASFLEDIREREERDAPSDD